MKGKQRIPRIKIPEHEIKDFPKESLQPQGLMAFLYDALERPEDREGLQGPFLLFKCGRGCNNGC